MGAKPRGQMAMLGSVVEHQHAIEMRSSFDKLPQIKQGRTHEAMPDREQRRHRLLFRERQEFDGKLKRRIAVTCYVIRHPEAVEHGEQQQWIFERLSKRFSLFDQQTGPLDGRLGPLSGKAFDREEWGYERDLKLDLLAAQRGRGG
jgi:hypothetical protein